MEKMGEKVAAGVLIGMGMMLVMLGFFGWFQTSYCLEKLRYIFKLVEIDASRHYLIADLNELMWIHVFFIVVGFVALLCGFIISRKK